MEIKRIQEEPAFQITLSLNEITLLKQLLGVLSEDNVTRALGLSPNHHSNSYYLHRSIIDALRINRDTSNFNYN